MTCFVTDLLQQIVVSSTVTFFVGFLFDSLDYKARSDIIIISNPIYQYAADLES